MATLSADQLLDLRADIGDDGTVFTDTELHRLYTRASSDYEGTVVLALWQLLIQAAKLYKYQIAQSLEDPNATFDHLKKMYDVAKAELAGADNQALFVSLRPVPPPDKDEP